MYGTKHVGIRRMDGARGWEAFDRETGNRIGMPHPSRWEAQAYAEHRQATTFGDIPVSPFVARALANTLPAKEIAR